MEEVVYITPNIAFRSKKITNPYIADLAAGWEENGCYVIRSPYANILRTVDLFLYLNKATILQLNWPEDLHNSFLGTFQVWILKRFIYMFRRKGGKVIWTMHNRACHEPMAQHGHKQFVDWILNQADVIVVHALEGLKLLPQSNKNLYFPHPFRPVKALFKESNIKYDALIWGNLAPYKGVDLFLEFLHKCGLQDEFRILVCGRCNSEAYAQQINQWKTSSILIENRFISDDELTLYFQQSRTVLFTHSGNSVLTSGTLAESLSHLKTVIAPDKGNFQDFAKEKILYTYNSFSEVIELLVKCRQQPEIYTVSTSSIKDTVLKYGWSSYVKNISDKLYPLSNRYVSQD